MNKVAFRITEFSDDENENILRLIERYAITATHLKVFEHVYYFLEDIRTLLGPDKSTRFIMMIIHYIKNSINSSDTVEYKSTKLSQEVEDELSPLLSKIFKKNE